MSEDLIKRSDAIKDLCDITNNSDMPEDWHRGMSVAISALYRVPSADRPQGEWKGYNADKGGDWLRDDGTPVFLVCDKCYGTVINNGSAHWNYCPNCGAKMKGADYEHRG